jgi:hypothetical protein
MARQSGDLRTFFWEDLGFVSFSEEQWCMDGSSVLLHDEFPGVGERAVPECSPSRLIGRFLLEDR